VVSERHASNRQKPYAQGQKTHSSIFHVVPYPSDTRILVAFLPENIDRGSDSTYMTNYNAGLFQKIAIVSGFLEAAHRPN